MGKAKGMVLVVIVVIALLAANTAFYTLNETEQGVITQFGKPVGEPVTEPGLHVKVPIVQKVNRFDKRFLEWDGDAAQVTTKDKRFIWLDSYARWRVEDPLLYFQRVRDERGAQTRLDDILDGETRNAIAKRDLVEVVRSTNREMVQSETIEEITEQRVIQITEGRSAIEDKVFESAREQLASLGIELRDFKFKRINYVEEVQQKIFDRMISERRRIADKFRSEGKGEYAKIMGDKERELKRIGSEAYRAAQGIRGEADAKATAIYASAFDRSPDTREFYEFLQTLQKYEQAINPDDVLVLSTDGDFFKYLRHDTVK